MSQTVPTIKNRPFLELATDIDYWRVLSPGFSITPRGTFPPAEPAEIDQALLTQCMTNLKEQGYFHLECALDKTEIEALATLVKRVVEMGWPAPFVAVYDEFWKITQRCARLAKHVLGYDYKLMPNFWVFHIPAKSTSGGWAPHRDRPLLNTITKEKAPYTLRLHIPLTQATAGGGDMSFLPTNLDPDYPGYLLNKRMPNLEHVKRVPADAGSIMGWNEAVLHWDNNSNEDSEEPRISLGFTLQSNVIAYESPLIDPADLPDFSRRLGLIGQVIRRFEIRDSIAMSEESWKLANKLSERFEIKRCPCVYCGGKSQIELDAGHLEKPASFKRALGEAKKFAEYAMQERGTGNISHANNLASIALDLIGLGKDGDLVEGIEAQLLFPSARPSAAQPTPAQTADNKPASETSKEEDETAEEKTKTAGDKTKTAEEKAKTAGERTETAEERTETAEEKNKTADSPPARSLETGPETPPVTSVDSVSDPESATIEDIVTVLANALGPQDARVRDALVRVIARGETWPSQYYGRVGIFYRKLLQVREWELGPFHPEIGDRLLQYATFLENNGQSVLAKEPIERAVAIRRERAAYGRVPKLALAQALCRLGASENVAKDYNGAEMHLREALGIVNELNWGGILAARVLVDLGTALYSGYRTSNYPEAESLFRRAIEVGLPVPAVQVLLRETALKLGHIYLFWGRISDAIKLFEHNRYAEHYRLVVPASNDTPVVQNNVIDESSNPYRDVFGEINQKFSPPDACSIARQALVRRYAWAIPNESALAAIKEYGPVVEIGAGTGYWAALLRARGVDIIAYDSAPMETGGSYYTTHGTSWTEVKKGTEEAASDHPDRALMLCWPVEFLPVATNALKAYSGPRFIYIGEGRGGKTGDKDFHDALENDWTEVKKVPIDNWHGSSDYLAIYERKAK